MPDDPRPDQTQTLPYRLVELRKSRNWTQAQLAAAVGASQSSVAEWEGGKSEPRIGTLRKIAEVFGIGIEEVDPVGMRHIMDNLARLPKYRPLSSKKDEARRIAARNERLAEAEVMWRDPEFGRPYIVIFDRVRELIHDHAAGLSDPEIIQTYLGKLTLTGLHAAVMATKKIWEEALQSMPDEAIPYRAGLALGRFEALLRRAGAKPLEADKTD